MNLEKEIFDISLKDIIPNRFQPREIFNDIELNELSKSIKEHGVIQPIIVRKVGDKYEIIAGERRFRASQIAGKETIPALVRDIDDKEAAKIALLENLQRSNLTPIEEAKTYQTILKIDNITQDELAANLGKSQSAIANKLRLLSLNEDVQTALLNSQISERHARSLLGLNGKMQAELLNRIIKEKLTVRQLDEEIMKLTGKMPNPDAEITEQGGKINQFHPETVNDQSNITSTHIEQPQITQPATQSPIIGDNINIYSNLEQNISEKSENITPENKEQFNKTINQPQTMPNETTEQNITFDKYIPEINKEPELNKEPVTDQNEIEEHSTETNFEELKTDMTENIFDKLRVESEEREINNVMTPNVANVIDASTKQEYNDVYDLRFAINNFRQAVQNTEKFGFKVTTNEYDMPTKYQIVIDIDKK